MHFATEAGLSSIVTFCVLRGLTSAYLRNENERLRAELRADVADSAQTELRNFERLKQPYAAQIRQLEHKVQELSVAIVDLKAERDR